MLKEEVRMNSTVKKVSICNVLCLLVVTLCMLTVGLLRKMILERQLVF